MLIEEMLIDMGHDVGAVASRIPDAIDLARTGAFDLAIVDINLDGLPSYPIAEILRERRIPFVFATGYGAAGIEPKYAGTPVLTKPFLRTDLEKLLSQVSGGP